MTGPTGLRMFCVGALLCAAVAWGAHAGRTGAVAREGGAQNAARGGAQPSIAMTVDDLPGALPGDDFAYGELKELQKINRGIPAALKAHHAWAIGFVNERKLQVAGERDARAELLQMWLEAGLTLGNHNYAHDDFSNTPLQKYEDDLVRGEVVTSALLKAAGQSEKYFRHPYLNTGMTMDVKTAFDAFLKDRSYTIAPVTIEDADYVFNDALGHAVEKKDKKMAARAKKEYLEYVDTVFDYAEKESAEMFGRQIPQILLFHDNALNMECLGALLEKLEKRGYKFVSLDTAMADPAYATSDLYVGTGILWMDRWKLALGMKLDLSKGPEPPAWAEQIFEQMRKERQKE
ncbi:MAG TPA: polysaccharide deacetylase family protein [Candidatus Acidoferrales bacterium]